MTYINDTEDKLLAQSILDNVFKDYDIVYTSAKDPYSPIDITFNLYTKEGDYIRSYAVECKHRRVNSDTYPDWILEEEKYKELLRYSSSGYTPMYFNTFEDNLWAIWDIRDVNTQPDTLTAPWHTETDKGKKRKKVYHLTINNARKLGHYERTGQGTTAQVAG